ncbi:hypothetical protein [Acetanaerobacterium elongatum]|uniref:LPXTG-motif cell wall anchor domain-containing protein n=1 Tax=Acetanaerobacterium elongatum TaxID=258515 RepID=A0A1G9ZQ98_9FIRM|nr:hypothetical protein [Acetanaerobacterium elongatum]SDN23752.1 hypothetical protein SAMN05192585_11420 [Acetanaerobacterium elongatum]
MKKVLALVLAAVMALSLATVVSAGTTILYPNTPGSTDVGSSVIDNNVLEFGEEAVSFFLDLPDGFVLGDSYVNNTVDVDAAKNTGDYSLSVSAATNNSDVTVETRLFKNTARDAVAIQLTVKSLSEKFTVEDFKSFKVTAKVVQADSKNKSNVSADYTFEGTVGNSRATFNDMFKDANGKWNVFTGKNQLKVPTATDARVIDVDVFEQAKGSALSINYDAQKYAVNFIKVTNQNTSLYLWAKTGVVAAPTKSIASIAFQPTRVKDAATVTMPISADNENLYGEKVWVYALVDGKPTGEAIEGAVVNHNSVIFTVPAGTALGTFAAYGDKAMGDAEKPAIPETGANDIVNIAIVFAVVALAAAGFVAVKKASK